MSRRRSQNELINDVVGSEEVGKAIEAVVHALDTGSSAISENVNLLRVIRTKTEELKTELLESDYLHYFKGGA